MQRTTQNRGGGRGPQADLFVRDPLIRGRIIVLRLALLASMRETSGAADAAPAKKSAVKREDDDDDTLFHTLYRFLVLFGLPELVAGDDDGTSDVVSPRCLACRPRRARRPTFLIFSGLIHLRAAESLAPSAVAVVTRTTCFFD